ncbi:MAG TPA: adenine deaminase C-terminal domain-containing protein, partial [Syntrophorhabdaceae bacterium]|nr:adenine deaminase C-terminal domain-containing protein [Syntrophorhabdaceae bacterium]
PELAKLKDHDVDKRRVMLVSDTFDPVMLCEEGYLDAVVRTAIRYGFTPMDAIKMATINPADYYGLRYLGAIAPLRYADILFLKSIEDVAIEKVMVGGEMVFEGGRFLKDIKPYEYPLSARQTISAAKCAEEDFKIKADPKRPEIRVIEVVNQTITREVRHRPSVLGGYLEKDLENDIIPVAVINRTNSRQRSNAFIKGTGIKNGALATTIVWDTANIFVIGSSEKDMAIAVNRIIDIQGGAVIISGGEIVYEFPTPVFGLISTDSMENIKDKIKELGIKLPTIGTSFDKPFLNIQTIPFTGLPFLRITDKGLADIKTKKLVSLFVE